MNILCIKIYAFKLHVQYSVQLYQFTGNTRSGSNYIGNKQINNNTYVL